MYFLDKFLDDSKYAGLDANGTTTDLPVFGGTAKFFIIKQSQIKNYESTWPLLELQYDMANVIPQYRVAWKNYDGTELYSEYVDSQVPTADPVDRKLISIPIKPADAQYTYTFSGWSPMPGSVIYSDTEYVAQYDKEVRKYTIKWKNYDGSTHTEVAEYGDSLYDVQTSVVETTFNLSPRKDIATNRYYVFDGWDKSVGYITQDLEVNAA